MMNNTIDKITPVVLIIVCVCFWFETWRVDNLKEELTNKEQTIAVLQKEYANANAETKKAKDINMNCEIAINKCVSARDKLIDAISMSVSKCQPKAVVVKKQSKPIVNSNDDEWGQ